MLTGDDSFDDSYKLIHHPFVRQSTVKTKGSLICCSKGWTFIGTNLCWNLRRPIEENLPNAQPKTQSDCEGFELKHRQLFVLYTCYCTEPVNMRESYRYLFHVHSYFKTFFSNTWNVGETSVDQMSVGQMAVGQKVESDHQLYIVLHPVSDFKRKVNFQGLTTGRVAQPANPWKYCNRIII